MYIKMMTRSLNLPNAHSTSIHKHKTSVKSERTSAVVTLEHISRAHDRTKFGRLHFESRSAPLAARHLQQHHHSRPSTTPLCAFSSLRLHLFCFRVRPFRPAAISRASMRSIILLELLLHNLQGACIAAQAVGYRHVSAQIDAERTGTLPRLMYMSITYLQEVQAPASWHPPCAAWRWKARPPALAASSAYMHTWRPLSPRHCSLL